MQKWGLGVAMALMAVLAGYVSYQAGGLFLATLAVIIIGGLGVFLVRDQSNED